MLPLMLDVKGVRRELTARPFTKARRTIWSRPLAQPSPGAPGEVIGKGPMSDNLKPRGAADVEAAIGWALAGDKTLEVVGRGTKRAIGRAAQWDATLHLSALTGITLYEPEELVLSAKAGTPLAEAEALAAASGQELAFEPMDYGPLLGVAAGAGTIGGALAANLSGPRRIKAGAARDHFLGVTAVSGRGETFKSGGRVVKNVTGYDLCKLLAGSWGTLAVMTEVTVKTLPRAESEETVLVMDLDDTAAGKVMAAVMGSFADVSAAAHLPVIAAARISETASAHRAVTAFRLEGVAPSIAHRKGVLERLVAPFGAVEALAGTASRAFWRAVRDVVPFAARPAAEDEQRCVWRISTVPSRGAEVGRTLVERAGAEVMYDWAGGLVWAAVPVSDDAHAPLVRASVAAAGGHATLIRAPAALRAKVDVFEPEPAVLAALTARVREGFDPRGLLNPGRMWAGV
jgi:glycolate oxidase FAD binding subunit